MRARWAYCCNIDSFEAYRPLVESILLGQRRIKKLVNCAVPTFRAKINYADRLIFTTKVIHGEPCLYIESVVKKHNYDRPQTLKASSAATSSQPEVSGVPPDRDEMVDYHEEMIYYAGHFIHLPREQTELAPGARISEARVPVVISGPAGTGKSCVLFNVARERLLGLKTLGVEGAHMLYVTKSSRLAHHQESLWGEGHPHFRLSFCSFEDWIAQHDVSCLTREKVGFEAYSLWLTARLSKEIDKKRLLVKTGTAEEKNNASLWLTFLEKLHQDHHVLYEEWRALPASMEAYLAYGARQSVCMTLTGLDIKPWVYASYQDYLLVLQQCEQWDPMFHRVAIEACYDVVLVDEGQDFSLHQLRLLLSTAKHAAMYCAMDSHQRLHDRLSLRPLWLDYVTQKMGRVEHVVLHQSYRCPVDVLRVVNVLMGQKRIVAGGKADRDEMLDLFDASKDTSRAVSASAASSVQFFEQKTASYASFQALCLSADCVVITRAEHVQEAKVAFATPLVCTAEEIKGLEFKRVIAYRLFDAHDGSWITISRRLAQMTGKSSPQHKSMRGEPVDAFDTRFNEVIVALTRVLEHLYVFINSSRELHDLLAPLKRAIETTEASAVIVSQAPISSQEEWLARAQSLALEGLNAQAEAIYCDKLKHTPTEFEAQKKVWQSTFSPSRSQAHVPRDERPMIDPSSKPKASPKTVACVSPMLTVTKAPTKAASAREPVALGSTPVDPGLTVHKPASVKSVLPKISKIDKVHQGLHKLYQNISVENLTRWCVSEKNMSYFAEVVLMDEDHPSIRWIEWVLQSPIHRACFVEFVRQYSSPSRILSLLNGARLGIYALHAAVIHNDVQYLQLCLDWDVDVDVLDEHCRTPFSLALQYGRLNMLRRFLQGTALLLDMEMEGWSVVRDEDGAYIPQYVGIPFYLPMMWISSHWLFCFDSERISSEELIRGLHREDVTLLQRLARYEQEGCTLTMALLDASDAVQAVCQRNLDHVHALIIEDNGIDWDASATSEGANALVIAVVLGLEEMVSTLVSSGRVNVNYKCMDGVTPLLLSIQHGYFNIMKILLRGGANVNQVTHDGFSPLLCAVHFGRVDAVQYLLAYGANILQSWWNLDTQKEYTPLSLSRGHAVPGLSDMLIESHSNLRLAEMMYRRFLTSDAMYDENSMSLMSRWPHVLSQWNLIQTERHLCFLEEILSDQKTTVRFIKALALQHTGFILEKILKLRVVDPVHHVLQIAARSRFGGLFLHECVKNKLNLNQPMAGGLHPLLVAISEANLLAVRAFIMSGITLTGEHSMHESPFYWTVIMDRQGSHAIILRQLLNSVEVHEHIRQGHENRAISRAIRHQHLACLQAFFSINLPFSGPEHDQLLHAAIIGGSLAIVELFLSKNSDLEGLNTDGETALLVAIRNQQRAMVSLLIDFQANVHAVALNSGLSTLMYAVLAQDPLMVHHLLSCQVNTMHCDHQGRTAQQIALEQGDPYIIALLTPDPVTRHGGFYGAFHQPALMESAENNTVEPKTSAALCEFKS